MRELTQTQKNYITAALRELECCMLPDVQRKEVQELQKNVDKLVLKE